MKEENEARCGLYIWESSDKKYKIVWDEIARTFKAFRNGEEWRDLLGDKMMITMLFDLCDAQKYKQALEDIADPINYLKRDAKESGCLLDGHLAVMIMKDAQLLIQIAKNALKE